VGQIEIEPEALLNAASALEKIVRPDLRGLGQSGIPDDLETGLNVEAYIDDLLAIIDTLVSCCALADAKRPLKIFRELHSARQWLDKRAKE